MISRQRQVSDSHTSQGVPIPESRESREVKESSFVSVVLVGK